jgi:hypothetical protein
MYFIQVCLLTTLTALFVAFRSSAGAKTIFFVPVAFVIFNLRQRTNLLWGYQITFAMTQAFAVLALFMLHTSRKRTHGKLALFGALVCATIATGSSIQGLLVWPAGLMQLLLLSGWKQPYRAMSILWASVGIGQWIFYFIGYERRRESPGGVTYLLEDPVSAIHHFLAILGNSLFSGHDFLAVLGNPLHSPQGVASLTGVMLLGLIGIVLYLARNFSGGLEEYAFWLSVLGFSLLVLSAITAGRMELDTNSALASRYTTFSLLAVASVYSMFAKLLTEHRSLTAVASFSFMVILVVLSATLSYKAAIPLGAHERTVNEAATTVLRGYRWRPDWQLTLLNNNPELVRHRARILERLHYNVFATARQE